MVKLERIEGPAYIVRVCPDLHEPGSMPPFEASGLIEFVTGDPAGIAWAKAFHGEMRLADWKDLLRELRALGITTLKAVRMGHHSIPFSTVIDGVHHIDVEALARRVN